MKIVLAFILFQVILFNGTVKGQSEEDFQAFGEELARTIVEDDTLAFRKLIIPKEAVLKEAEENLFKGFTESEIKLALQRIDENYEPLYVSNYSLSFFFARQMVELQQLDLKNTSFTKVENSVTRKDKSIIAIQGDTKRKEFPYFTFYLTKIDGQYYLANSDFMISEVNPIDDVDFFDSEDTDFE